MTTPKQMTYKQRLQQIRNEMCLAPLSPAQSRWLLGQVEELRAVLKEIEWVRSWDDDESHCPYCRGWRSYGHYTSCIVRAALEGEA